MNFNEAYKNITNSFDIAKIYNDEIFVLHSLANLRYIKHAREIGFFVVALFTAYSYTSVKGIIYSKFDYLEHKIRFTGKGSTFEDEIVFKFYSIMGTVYTVGIMYNDNSYVINDGGERKGYEASED